MMRNEKFNDRSKYDDFKDTLNYKYTRLIHNTPSPISEMLYGLRTVAKITIIFAKTFLVTIITGAFIYTSITSLSAGEYIYFIMASIGLLIWASLIIGYTFKDNPGWGTVY